MFGSVSAINVSAASSIGSCATLRVEIESEIGASPSMRSVGLMFAVKEMSRAWSGGDASRSSLMEGPDEILHLATSNDVRDAR